MVDLVVTRHPALIEYLLKYRLVKEGEYEMIEHATVEDVKGRRVIGVLPHSLSCHTESITEVPLNIPVEMRGRELTLEDLERYAGNAVTYRVEIIKQ